jgi:hypothetical protein
MPIFTLVDMAHRYDEEIVPQEEEEFNAVDLYGNPCWFDCVIWQSCRSSAFQSCG